MALTKKKKLLPIDIHVWLEEVETIKPLDRMEACITRINFLSRKVISTGLYLILSGK